MFVTHPARFVGDVVVKLAEPHAGWAARPQRCNAPRMRRLYKPIIPNHAAPTRPAAKPTSADDWTAGMAASGRGDRGARHPAFEQVLQLATDSPTAQCNLDRHRTRHVSSSAHRLHAGCQPHAAACTGLVSAGQRLHESANLGRGTRRPTRRPRHLCGPDAALLRNRPVAHLRCRDLDAGGARTATHPCNSPRTWRPRGKTWA